MHSPKTLFQRTPSVKILAAHVAEPWFQEALIAALAQMAWTQPRGENLATSWDAHNRLIGAREFIAKLAALHEIEKELPTSKSSGLNYDIPQPLSQKPK